MRQYDSLTNLVSLFNLSLNPVTISNALLKIGVFRQMSYLSTTGSGKEKHFNEIVPEFITFGINRSSMHEFKTEPRFYIDSFPDLVLMVIEQLVKEAKAMREL